MERQTKPQVNQFLSVNSKLVMHGKNRGTKSAEIFSSNSPLFSAIGKTGKKWQPQHHACAAARHGVEQTDQQKPLVAVTQAERCARVARLVRAVAYHPSGNGHTLGQRRDPH